LQSFGFVFFVDGIIIVVGLRIFGQDNQVLHANPMSHFWLRFFWKEAITWVLEAITWVLREVEREHFVTIPPQHFESQPTNISYLDFGLKPAVFGCLTNAIAHLPIVLESCSRAQTDWPVF